MYKNLLRGGLLQHPEKNEEPDQEQKENSIKIFKILISFISALFRDNPDEKYFYGEKKLFINNSQIVFKFIHRVKNILVDFDLNFKNLTLDFTNLKNSFVNKFEDLKNSLNEKGLEKIFKNLKETLNKEKIYCNQKNSTVLKYSYDKLKENIKFFIEDFTENKIRDDQNFVNHLYLKILENFYKNIDHDRISINLISKNKISEKRYLKVFETILEMIKINCKKEKINLSFVEDILILSCQTSENIFFRELENCKYEFSYHNLLEINSFLCKFFNINSVLKLSSQENQKIQYVHFLDRRIIPQQIFNFSNLEKLDYKIYHQQSSINDFITENLNHLLSALKLNPNIIKLYIEEELKLKEKNSFILKDYNKVNLVKISRTPAYGTKKIIISEFSVKELNNENILGQLPLISLKPTQLFLFLLSKSFADIIIQGKLRFCNQEFCDFLKLVNFNKNFYTKNYENLIKDFYVIDREIYNKSLVCEKSHEFNLEDIQENLGNDLIVRKLNSLEMEFLLCHSFNIMLDSLTISKLSEIIFGPPLNEKFSSDIIKLKVLTNIGDLSFLQENNFTKNFDFNPIFIFFYSKQEKSKNYLNQIKNEPIENYINDIKRNPLCKTFNNKYINSLLQEEDHLDNEEITNLTLNLEKYIKTLINIGTVKDFLLFHNQIKKEYLKILAYKKKIFENVKIKIEKIKNDLRAKFNKNNQDKSIIFSDEIKDEISNILKIHNLNKINRNIEILKFLVDEIEIQIPILHSHNKFSNNIQIFSPLQKTGFVDKILSLSPTYKKQKINSEIPVDLNFSSFLSNPIENKMKNKIKHKSSISSIMNNSNNSIKIKPSRIESAHSRNIKNNQLNFEGKRPSSSYLTKNSNSLNKNFTTSSIRNSLKLNKSQSKQDIKIKNNDKVINNNYYVTNINIFGEHEKNFEKNNNLFKNINLQVQQLKTPQVLIPLSISCFSNKINKVKNKISNKSQILSEHPSINNFNKNNKQSGIFFNNHSINPILKRAQSGKK
jgi:hypothetical protein